MVDQPPYARIASEIQRRIEAGELRPGDRVPSTRQITQRWGVAIATATKALTTLRQQGLVEAAPGRGTVVAASLPRQPATAGRPARSAENNSGTHVSAGPAEVSTRGHIVRTAARIADAEGLTAVTMRRVATELDVATMSLYRHVHNKEQLITLMADAAFAEKPLPAPGGSWRTQLRTSAHIQWTLYRAHPWLARTVNINRPLMAVGGMRHVDWAIRVLDGHGLDSNTLLHTAITLFGYVRGAATDLETEKQAARDTGISGDEWRENQETAMTTLLAGGDLPAFAAVRRQPGVALSVHSLFEYGLERLLDGVGLLIPHDAALRGVDD